MPIATIRRLEGLGEGTKLSARYKGRTYHAEVVRHEDGTFALKSERKEFKSPSAAAKAITGAAANGWVFWSRADEAEAAATAKAEASKARATTVKPEAKPKAERKPRAKAKPAAEPEGTTEDATASDAATEPEREPVEDAA